MSATTRNQVFSAVQTVGALLPADMLARISEGKDTPGSRPADYALPSSRSVRDEAERSWEYLRPLWRELRKSLPEDPDTGAPAADPTGLAAAEWLAPLWRELGFGPLTPVGPDGITADSDSGRTFPVSHRWGHALIHQTAWNAGLDRRPGGAGTVPPQSMLQECLNRTDRHLWGVLTNGRQVRLLRDSSALATASYVEFDLEAIFDGELFSEFVLLYRLLHVSRFAVAPDAPATGCWLEKWRTEAIASGTRALDQLRKGVQEAVTTLGTGFLRHPANTALRENVDAEALHNALLRLVYRLLFVFVAEDRDALLRPDAGERERSRYAAYFSSARLRGHARRRRGTAHGDLYEALCIVLRALGDVDGRPELGLPGLGGIFDDTEADAPLHGLSLSNEYLLTAVRHLSQVRDAGARRRRTVDYRHLDAEELGSIYESLLELVPRHSAVDRTFALVELAGNTRKTTGSYYTPSSLIECLLDTGLDPVLDDAVARGERAAAEAGEPDPADAIVRELLSLTVCDPACGSGHFLVAAARRIAKRVAAVQERNPEPTLGAVRHALHEVVARCVYGVDLNPMAVELAKVSLWLEALEPGKPLGFLDAHVKHGNALIGATPSLLRGGIPDEAFKPIEGDDKKYAKALERQNRAERGGQHGLFDLMGGGDDTNEAFALGLRRITDTAPGTLAEVHGQEAAYRDFAASAAYVRALRVADAWCAAFMWRKAADAPPPVTEEVFRLLQDPASDTVPRTTHAEITRLRHRYRFFHWHLEFPEVFTVRDTGDDDAATGWAGGFDCVLGNPPWERIKLQEQEFFAQRDMEIAAAKTAAARKRLIAALKQDPDGAGLHAEFEVAKRKAEGDSHFLRNAGRYPLTGRGDINTYAVFAETGRMLTGPRGRMGMIVPTGIATDATTQFFFRDLVVTGSLAALYDFENAAPVFPDVHRSFKFSLLSLTGRGLSERAARFAFFLRDPAELADAGKVFALTPEEITLLNPNTGTCPVFRSRRDAEITLGIYERVPVLIDEGDPDGNPWGVTFGTMFHMSNDSHLFRTREELTAEGFQPAGNAFVGAGRLMLPLYEAKMVDAYNHRAADVVKSATAVKRQNQPAYLSDEDRASAFRLAVPGSWVDRAETPSDAPPGRLAFLRISSPTNQRTMISAILPPAAIGDSVFLLRTGSSQDSAVLAAHFNSFVYDYVTRQKVAGLNLNFFYIRQLPVLPPATARRHADFLVPRVLELTYTAHDMSPFAHDLGDTGAPFRWDQDRRRQIRAELDAFFFHLYGIGRDDIAYIMDTFPIVRRKDEARYGDYRTRDLILTAYDAMTPLTPATPYTSPLTPPPGHGPRHP
ncbi:MULTISPECIES: Eco57I restriction-modification methylase domain-containing protein [unclassified Streptomyces]|uniref:Eco57I restriction-modification methylase domain-containing protein n=1 Tax=unclassified Streptomyces TaxID=2593676 RepID=UPI000DAF2DAE|nr:MULTISPECIES: DNA methyltransferase [unclassified Streptomyces]PZT77670.1 SAM-dependent DNA methyltransferase [Streptomyces sp. AC1-42W]PZT78377.1 SAM-dependent DNA methyltransferase [Streptomyces sp. AC1-42T]